MDESPFLNDEAILTEIGRRLARRRVDQALTQATLAEQAGVSKRTVERLEAGASTQLSSLIRILRALGLQEELLRLVPEMGPSPMDLLKLKGKERQRASSRRRTQQAEGEWSWGDES